MQYTKYIICTGLFTKADTANKQIKNPLHGERRLQRVFDATDHFNICSN